MLLPRRRRPIFASAPQLRVLESAFLSKNNPDEEDKARLASETGLNPGWITDWFTRRRKKKRSPEEDNSEARKTKRRRAGEPDAEISRDCAGDGLDYQENENTPSNLTSMGGFKMEMLRYMPITSLPSSSRQSSISAGETDPRISECSTPANKHNNDLIGTEASFDSIPSSLSSGSLGAGQNNDTPSLTPDLGSSESHDSSRSLSQSPSLGYIPATFPSFPAAHTGTQHDDPKTHLEGTQSSSSLSLPLIQPDPTVFNSGNSLDLSEAFRASNVFTQLSQNTVLTPPRLDSTFNTHHSSQLYSSRLGDISYGLGFSSGGLQTRSTSLNGSFGPQAPRPVPLSFRVRLSDLNAYHQAILELNLLRNIDPHDVNEGTTPASVASSENLPPSLSRSH